LLVVGIKLGELVVVGAFEMSLPGSEFRPPDDLSGVFCVKGDMGLAFVFAAFKIGDVDSVYLAQQRLIGTDGDIHTREAIKDRHSRSEVVTLPDLARGGGDFAEFEARYVYNRQITKRRIIENDKVGVDEEFIFFGGNEKERFSPASRDEYAFVSGLDLRVGQPGDESSDITLGGGGDFFVVVSGVVRFGSGGGVNSVFNLFADPVWNVADQLNGSVARRAGGLRFYVSV